MKKILTLVALSVILCLPSLADNIITSGTKIKVLSGTSLVSTDNMVIKSGGTLDNSGTLILKKNLTNENSTANSLGSGTLVLSGSVTQNITGTNTVQNLTVNNSAGVTNGGGTRVNGTLALTSGVVTLGSNNLTLGPSATVAGTPSATAMIVVTSSGQLRKEFSAAGTFVFPVGDATGTSEYSPVTIVLTSGTFASGSYVAVTLVDDKYPDANITGNYLTRYWTLTQSGITGFSCNPSFQYLPADVVGTETKLSCTKVNPLPWVTYALTNSGSHLLSASGITSFSSFTGLKSTTPPANQELANITIPSGTTTCYDATSHLTAGGNGTTFIIQSGGNVTLVAGNMISLLPGVKVYSGGYLYGHISTTYCGAMMEPLVAVNPDVSDPLLAIPENNLGFIKIYPNPTADLVTLEISFPEGVKDTYVAIYNMNGKQIAKQELNGVSRHQFSLSGQPVGIYMVRVQTDDRVEIAKIVRK